MAVTEKNSRRRILLGESNNALFNLVAINAVIFVILGFIQIIYKVTTQAGPPTSSELFQKHVLDWIALPGNFSTFATRPWTLLTAMFIHVDAWLLISNMLWLWAFGYILQDLTGNRQIVPLYLYGGLAGGVVFLAICTLSPGLRGFSPELIGANAGIMAIAIATTMVSPDYRIFPMLNGGIPLWILTIVYVAIDLAGVGGAPYAYHLSHAAGAAMGFVFVQELRKGRDWGGWMHSLYQWVMNLANPNNVKEKKVFKKELFYKNQGNPPYTKTPLITQQKVDELLDKISQKGYQHLTEEEREFLKRASEEEEL
ncbi:rhomboid family intramembrane serine protease [Dinghuibacter silviterrae]|uniref:Membrane associated rhomboid family serine protease n=1 Tax=Dinghuibacter silviterrae TaxID=1539049 RepID=A0A4R8DND5_9BACT|nr:rhomboid family intramembrane serine protease [Dinghuibacter silviterrae]TDW99549.1 membrane associated rhomboid family serine protease [Dinghuibacter silviterrae]